MLLEASIRQGETSAYPFEIVCEGANSPFRIDLRPMVRAMAEDLLAGQARDVVAGRFHNTVVEFLSAAAVRARELTGLGVVAVSGGCFANRHVAGGLLERLRRDGLEVLAHREFPCNDGCVALGQAVVAAARHHRGGPTAAAALPGS